MASAPPTKNNGQLRVFREKAEEIITDNGSGHPSHYREMEIQELLHELQIFQIELEMQNDELKISHEHLEAERSKFAGLYDLAPVGYLILDKLGTILEANCTALEMLGAAREQVTGRRFQNYIDNASNETFYGFIRKMRDVNKQNNCEVRVLSENNKAFYATLAGAGIRNKMTGDLQFYIAVIDITERREAERHLQETNERLKMTLEASGTGTWEIDLKKQCIILGEHSYNILGLNRWEFDGQYETFFRMVHPHDKDRVKQTVLNAIKKQKDLDIEYRVTLKHGIRYLSVRGQIIRANPDVMRFVGIIIDITEKKQFEKEAEDLKQHHQNSIITAGLQAQEKERKRISESLHDSVSQLLYGVKLNLQEITRGSTADERLVSINSLIDQAIIETRNISFELAPSILHDFGLTESVKEMAKRLTTPAFTVNVKATGSVNRLDPGLEISAFRIIQELVNNSIKHGRASHALITIMLMKEQVMITVKDNGAGFKIKNNDYLLRGSGLLSIKNRVSLLNGTFDISSAPRKGTTVNITLKSG